MLISLELYGKHIAADFKAMYREVQECWIYEDRIEFGGNEKDVYSTYPMDEVKSLEINGIMVIAGSEIL